MFGKDVGQVCVGKDVVDFSVVFYCKVDLATDIGEHLEREYVRDPVESEELFVLCGVDQKGHSFLCECTTNLWPISELLQQPVRAA